MKESAFRKIFREELKKSMNETLTSLGIDVLDVRDTQADFLYLRKIRKGSEDLALKAKKTLIAFLIPTIFYLLWEATKNLFHR